MLLVVDDIVELTLRASLKSYGHTTTEIHKLRDVLMSPSAIHLQQLMRKLIPQAISAPPKSSSSASSSSVPSSQQQYKSSQQQHKDSGGGIDLKGSIEGTGVKTALEAPASNSGDGGDGGSGFK